MGRKLTFEGWQFVKRADMCRQWVTSWWCEKRKCSRGKISSDVRRSG